jgi:hypothetical protein
MGFCRVPFPVVPAPVEGICTVIRVLRNLLLLAALGVFVLPAAAQADPVSDCAGDGDLDKNYSNEQLRDAVDNIPGDLDEYSNCREVFKAAISSGSDKRNDTSSNNSGGSGGSSGGGGGGSISGDEQQARVDDNADLEAITGDANDAKPRVKVGGERLEPGPSGLFDLASASNEIPTPLLVALIAIGLLAILGGLVALRKRVPALARIPLVSKIPRVSLPRFRR